MRLDSAQQMYNLVSQFPSFGRYFTDSCILCFFRVCKDDDAINFAINWWIMDSRIGMLIPGSTSFIMPLPYNLP